MAPDAGDAGDAAAGEAGSAPASGAVSGELGGTTLRRNAAKSRRPLTRHEHTKDPVVAALDVVDPDHAHDRRVAAQREREAPASYDRSLRAKLQRRYQALAKRNKRPITPLPTLPDVQCLGTIANGLTRGRCQLLEVIQQAMMVGDPLATAWWTVYAELTPEERKVVNLDEVGLAAGVDYAAFMGALVTVNTRLGADTRQLVFESVQVSTILAAAANATLPAEDGFPDRQMLLQGSGLVPVPKGHTTQVTVTATAKAAAAAQTEAAGRGLGFLDDVAGAEDARGTVQQRLIEEAKVAEPVFEGVTVKQPVPVAVVAKQKEV